MPTVFAAVALSALAFSISVFSFFYFRAYLRRRTAHGRILAELREEVNGILRLINETTDKDISLIEEREKNLKALLEDVDKRLRLYVREMERKEESQTLQASLVAQTQTPPPPQPHTPTYLELGKNRYRVSAPQPGELFAPPVPPADAAATAESTAAEELSPVEQIRSLVRAGFTPPVVASRLGISIAEVEVVAALMERREE
ncbi:MAG: hypothetical protein FWD91_02295 [Treponema sp.]|nr:hypothetical protein [Treponema sp.]